MTIENGLDTPDTALLDKMLEDGTLDERVAVYLHTVRTQSIGWQVHDKVICNLLRVSSYILRNIKRAVAKLPGIRRVRYANHKGIEYDGLLVGDHAEGEGYKIVGWYDGDAYIPGAPPMLVPAPLNPTHKPSTSRAQRGKKQALEVLPAGGASGPEDADGERADEPKFSERNSAARVELEKVRQARPDLAGGVAIVDVLLDRRTFSVSWAVVDKWQNDVQNDVGPFTRAEAYAGIERVKLAGRDLTAQWIARGIRAVRTA